MDAVVVANAPMRWTPELVGLVRLADLVVAADGGANALARIGVRPAAVVGDLDSISPGVRRWVGEERVLLRGDQERTDLDKALSWVVDERGAERVTVLGATGGRLDHAVEALALLGRWAGRVGLEARDADLRIVPVDRRASLTVRIGQTVSLLPLGRCEGVRTEGLHWPLDREPLDLAERTGISNRAVAESVVVEVAAGVLLVALPGS